MTLKEEFHYLKTASKALLNVKGCNSEMSISIEKIIIRLSNTILNKIGGPEKHITPEPKESENETMTPEQLAAHRELERQDKFRNSYLNEIENQLSTTYSKELENKWMTIKGSYHLSHIEFIKKFDLVDENFNQNSDIFSPKNKTK
jgi:hypothetical protein